MRRRVIEWSGEARRRVGECQVIGTNLFRQQGRSKVLMNTQEKKQKRTGQFHQKKKTKKNKWTKDLKNGVCWIGYIFKKKWVDEKTGKEYEGRDGDAVTLKQAENG